MADSGTVTIALSSHRPEVLPLAAPLMERHEAILLEEPPHPHFPAMLEGRLAIDAYLGETDLEFPRFGRESCELLRALHRQGKRIFQIDPFMQLLGEIHECFAEGGRPEDIEANTKRGAVYEAEKAYSATLLDYYGRCLTAPFDTVVETVKAFARADAARGRLRDRMRATAIAAILPAFRSVYIEAGSIHLALCNELRAAAPTGYRVRPAYLLASVARRLCGRRQTLGPGELLTLLYTFRPDYRKPRADLLAARSLVHVKLLEKEEMTDPGGTFPHTRNEAESAALAGGLSYADCQALYARIKQLKTAQARVVVQEYLRALRP